MKKFFVFALAMFAALNMLAVDFLMTMSASDAQIYIDENNNNNGAYSWNLSFAKFIVYFNSNPNISYQDVVDEFGKEKACNFVYVLSVLADSPYCDKAKEMFADKLNTANFFEDVIFFNDNIVCSDYWLNKSRNNYVFAFVNRTYSKDLLGIKIIAAMDKYLDMCLNNENYVVYYDNMLTNLVKSYQCIYLDIDESVVKSDLKRINSKAYMLLELSENYKSVAMKIKMLYKSLE